MRFCLPRFAKLRTKTGHPTLRGEIANGANLMSLRFLWNSTVRCSEELASVTRLSKCGAGVHHRALGVRGPKHGLCTAGYQYLLSPRTLNRYCTAEMMTKVLSCVCVKSFSLSLDLSGPLRSLETKDKLGPCCVIFFPPSEDIWHGFP